MNTLRLILGDQLNYKHSWYQSPPGSDIWYIIMEMRQETDYTTHHAQKIIGFFASMYNFSEYLRKRGHQVIHLKINDSENQQDLCKNLEYYIQKLSVQCFEYQLPDEYRLDEQLTDFCQSLSIRSKAYDTEHFLTTRSDLANHFKGKKTYLMESFYRAMRKKYQILMNGDEPEGGQWNFDSDNRNPYKGEVQIPEP
jgi:deoxyribodipyrimidine photolyase-related protein